jgi:DNA-binding Lrp family transcriptional regulator
MPEALLCIKTQPNCDKEVIKQLSRLKEVKEVFAVIGKYDIIAKVESNTFDDLVNFDQSIRRIPNVTEILSMLLIKSKDSALEQENGVLVF